jgi:acetyltransferase-like isoleucine patch superfamily enzyme
VPISLLARVSDRLEHEWSRRRLVRLGVELGEGVRFHGTPIVELAPGSSLRIGRSSVLTSRSSHTALGVAHPVVIRTLRASATIEIGDDVGISGGSICAATSVTIGEGTLLGADVIVADTDFHPVRHAQRRHAPVPVPAVDDAVRIGRNVFIGTRAIVLKGSTIGDDAVVGAGAVVSGHVASGSIVAGNPARVLDPGAVETSGIG